LIGPLPATLRLAIITMETKPSVRGLDGRVWKNICFNANRLASRAAVPGMMRGDYRQDLALDLVQRSAWYEPIRASFPTFADRVISHRAAVLAQPTAMGRLERTAISFDAIVLDEDGNGVSVLDRLADDAPPVDEVAFARIDLDRFLHRLPSELLQCCAMLEGGAIGKEAKAAGIHRSTAYERISRLRAEAVEAGLDVYVERVPDRFESTPVSDPENADADDGTGEVPERPMSNPRRPTLLVTLIEFQAWYRSAEIGEALEYHRGFLPMDRALGSRLGEADRNELDRLADAVIDMATVGHVHLVQRRHGPGDYGYLVVASRGGRRAEPRMRGAAS